MTAAAGMLLCTETQREVTLEDVVAQKHQLPERLRMKSSGLGWIIYIGFSKGGIVKYPWRVKDNTDVEALIIQLLHLGFKLRLQHLRLSPTFLDKLPPIQCTDIQLRRHGLGWATFNYRDGSCPSTVCLSHVVVENWRHQSLRWITTSTAEGFRMSQPDLIEQQLLQALLQKEPHTFKSLHIAWEQNDHAVFRIIERHQQSLESLYLIKNNPLSDNQLLRKLLGLHEYLGLHLKYPSVVVPAPVFDAFEYVLDFERPTELPKTSSTSIPTLKEIAARRIINNRS